MHTPHPGAPPAPTPRRWWILAVIAAAQAMLIIDVTVLNVALPSIGADLRLDRAALTAIATAYTLFFGSLLLLGGRLADAFGRRRTFLVGLTVFTGASLASGLAPDGTTLLGARIVQGIGAALLSPAALSIVTTTFDGAERNRALGVWAAVGGSGAAIGVVLGGILTTGPGWEWIFFVNVPIGIAAGLAVWRIVPASAAAAAGPIDIAGAALATTAIGLALFGLIQAGESGWIAPTTLAPIGLALLAGAAFVLVERRVPAPLLRPAALAAAGLRSSVAILIVAAGLLAGSFFLASLYLQRLIGLTALETGLAFLPGSLAIIAGAHLASRAVGRQGARSTAALGLLVTAVGATFLAGLSTTADVIVDVLPGLVLVTFGLGMTMVSATTAAFADVDHRDAGVASGLVNTSHELGFALGVAVLSAIAAPSLVGDALVASGFQAGFGAAALVAVAAAFGARAVLPAVTPGAERPAFAH